MGVIELQQIICDFKLHLFAFALLQMDTLEALQLLYRAGDAGYDVVDIELYDFYTVIVASVRYGDRCRASVKTDVTIFEGGIAQSVPSAMRPQRASSAMSRRSFSTSVGR